MRDFSIVCNLQLVLQPSWLDNFREQYDDNHPYHVTLKNSTYLRTGSEEELKEKLQKVLVMYKQFTLSFKNVFHSLTKRGECIMISVELNSQIDYLVQLQKEIRSEFSNYGEHIKPAFRQYEEDFTPHLTIGRHLDSEMFAKAWKEIESHQDDTLCKAKIDRILLVFAEAYNEQEDETSRVSFEYVLE